MNDIGEDGEDLSGGYFDAGDFMKFGLPMAYSMTTLGIGQRLFFSASHFLILRVFSTFDENTFDEFKLGEEFSIKKPTNLPMSSKI